MGMGPVMQQLKAKLKTTPVFTTPPDVEYTQNPIGLTPFIRENDINFSAKSLKPDTDANFFFDEILVNNFCQRASVINVTSNLALSNVRINDGIFGQTSNAYAEVLGTSLTATRNLLYVNDNFISTRIAPADAINITSTEFQIGDLVYQTADDNPVACAYTGFAQPDFTFLGKVVKFRFISTAESILVVDPILGRMNISATKASSYVLRNMSKDPALERNATRVYANNRFIAGETLQYASNSVSYATVSASNSYIALSSAISDANTSNLRSIVLSCNNTTRDAISNANGNTLYIVSGTNMGFSATINRIVANTNGWTEAFLSTAMPELPTSNTIYSLSNSGSSNHMVDDVGALHGIFHIPSDNNLRWLTGERTFTITDTNTYNDNGYRMRAVSKYTALGKVNSTENARNFVLREQSPSTGQAAPSVIQETQKINDRKYMAQTFFTPKASEVVDGQVKASFGMFLTSVDLFFKSKPTDNEEQIPFTVAISKVESDLPGNNIIAERTLEAGYVQVSNNPSTSNTSTLTKFTFKDPVYLAPSTEYAIKLITESPDYEVWTAMLGEDYVDQTGNIRKVSDQPYVGNLFKSQNASNWNPILNQDLMFNVNRASFASSNTVYFNIKNDEDLRKDVIFDAIRLTSTEQQFSPTSIKYEIETKLANAAEDTQSYFTINNNEVYKFGKDTNVSTVLSKRRRLIRAANTSYMNVKVTLSTTDDAVSPMINRERFGISTIQNIINNAGISNNLISITSTGNHPDATGIVVTFSAPDVGANTANGYITSALFNSGNILGIMIDNPGAGYFTTPTITITDPAASINATAIVNGETDSTGGNVLSGYQTKIVELANGFDAGDLIVRLDMIKPAGTDVGVYYKVLSNQDKDSFVSKKWQKMTKVPSTAIDSPDQSTIVNTEYRHSLDISQIEYFDGDRSYPLGGKFKYFAIKLALTAQDPTVIPMIDSLKVLAVPGENKVTPLIDGGTFIP
jgi:hypothetical protein